MAEKEGRTCWAYQKDLKVHEEPGRVREENRGSHHTGEIDVKEERRAQKGIGKERGEGVPRSLRANC